MSTSSRPRRAGARVSAAALAALTATGAALITAPAAVAAPSDPDAVVIHRVGRDNFNSPVDHSEVCDFYLAALNFAPGQTISWTIDRDADPVATGSITVADTGNGYTQPVMPSGQVRLPNGQYRLTWEIVADPDATPPPSPSPSSVPRNFMVKCPPTAPNGGPPAGGGGLAMAQDFTPVAGAAAVGLAAVGGVVYLRLRRRRPDGAA